ncbi:MAG TPA: ATP-binding cassette domain-containing protein [Conexibacter sp.]|jgi:ABC-type lipoprotein export system ATPase subunit|nr:ATP-binding cassette domain-containing protein [Conexibacter sp.]
MTLLALEQVSKSHWRGRHEIVVLDDVSLEVEAGELVAIFGQRAAGKTTLLRIAAGIDAPDAGTVRFEGRDLGAGRLRRLTGIHARIGWVGRQGPFASGMRMLDHVALPLLRVVAAGEAERRATRALKRVGAGDLANARWHELSDAERTLVTIAHAVVRDPALLLADDPTSGLGIEERETVLALLRSIAEERGMAVLATVPEIPDALRSHRVMSLGDGELIQAMRRDPGEVIAFPQRRDERA